MIQVQHAHVLFSVAKYWLCFAAADWQNSEMQAGLEETSVNATSGLSQAQ